MSEAPCCDGGNCNGCPGDYVCGCLKITEDQILASVAAGANTVRELKQMIGAGDGCTACHPRLREYLRFAAQRQPLELVEV